MLDSWLPPPGAVFAFLGLGSNLDDCLAHLQAGVDLLHAHRRVRVDAVSSVYQTEPVGGPDQRPYLNIAVRAATTASPRGLLRICQRVERARGRVRDERWGPRTLDIDILLYGDRAITSRVLQVPHPRLRERAFALVPLVEVAPGAGFPDGQSIASAVAALAPIEGVTMIGSQVRAPGGARS